MIHLAVIELLFITFIHGHEKTRPFMAEMNRASLF